MNKLTLIIQNLTRDMGNCVVSANNQLRMSVLQVTTTLIAMASEKYIRWLKVTNWQSTDLEIKINKYMAIWSNSQTYKGWWHNMKCAPIDTIFFGNHFYSWRWPKGNLEPWMEKKYPSCLMLLVLDELL